MDGADMPTNRLRRIREQRAGLEREMAELDRRQFEAMDEARGEGYAWSQIARVLGMTSSGARRWYRRHKNSQRW